MFQKNNDFLPQLCVSSTKPVLNPMMCASQGSHSTRILLLKTVPSLCISKIETHPQGVAFLGRLPRNFNLTLGQLYSVSVLSVILILMCLMAIVTDLIGVQAVLGALLLHRLPL
jgi:Kef-type K+ transport system membrane component KefB